MIIEKLDNHGRGICYINNKITFIENALPNEEVEIKITKENKKYNEGIVTKYIKKSSKRIEPKCPYFEECGGCNLLNTTYEETIKYKKDKLESIMSKYAKINKNIDIIESQNTLNYRNKITLKVINNKYGYYVSNTHKLVPINNCLLAEQPIKEFIKDINKLNIKNGEVIIRSNYNEELLIVINTKDKINPDIEYLKENHKIVGFIVNNEIINGDNKFIEIINNKMFQVSYDSFFQINRYICGKLFELINDNIKEGETILDLYCGVGTLGLNANKAKKIYGIEIIPNAIINAITNAKINKQNNAYYMVGNTSKCIDKINDKIDTIIIDPPRSGLDEITRNTIIDMKPNKILYISCDPMTLARDLNILKEYYNINLIKGLDMFPYTYHIETICIMERR